MSTTLARAAARLIILPVAASIMVSAPAASHAATPASVTAAPASTAVAVQPRAEVQAQTRTVVRKAATKRSKAAALKARGAKVLKAVRSRKGKPYRYGATGPHSFDCSGLTRWVYKKVGKKLPRTSRAQVGATRRVKNPKVGDLVFFRNGSRVYHVGIYAGRHQVWHAPYSGTKVRKERIWTSSVFYGRVR